MRYTNIVSKGSRNPEADNLPIFFISLFYPLLFCEWQKSVPRSFPREPGRFSVRKNGKRPLPKETKTFQRLFKIRSHIKDAGAVYWSCRKEVTPFFRTAAKFVFSFSFPPFSNKECAPQITVSPTAAERFLISETNLSKTVQKLFTHKRRGCGILTLSAREAATPWLATYRSFLFLFFTPFFQICILNEQAPFPLPPAWRCLFPFSGKRKAFLRLRKREE